MLEHLRIRGLGVIEDAELDLSPGLTVLTGETGAGKTMVVTGLGLLLGGKADAGRVRPGERAAVVEGLVRVPLDHPAARRAREAGAELEDDDLLLARTVSVEGRSRAHAGGRAVPLAVLTEIGDELVAVHGQHDQRRLLAPARQRAALDRYAGPPAAAALASYSTAYQRLRDITRELTELTTTARERAREADLLRYGLEEIEAVSPLPDEDVTLAAEDLRLAHADALRDAASSAHDALLGDPHGDGGSEVADAVGLVGTARRFLDGARQHDAELAQLADRLAEASYLLSDVGSDLAAYASSVDVDPLRLAAVQDRRAAIGALTRKYGDTAADVLAWAERAAVRVAGLDGDDDRIAQLRSEHDQSRTDLGRLAGALSGLRQDAASTFSAAVTAELAELAMPHAVVSVAVTRMEATDGIVLATATRGKRTPAGPPVAFGPTGVDDVEILLSPHPGAPPRALDKGASGGELSRVMLAVEVVFAGADPVPTFVFDEVDAGVGGKAAVEIGRRLARLAQDAQVLVVTHLPQVAAFADRHLHVVKAEDGSITRSGVVALDDAARVRELSRMLAGQEGSRSGQAHARELLAAAGRARTS